jgi:tRNA threonylcarbamoyladenosine biosynthesis protein TsaE
MLMDRLQLVCNSPARTQAVASAIAATLLPGDVIVLDGDLGAGKTTFVQGLARAMGVDEVVTSPTFTLMRSYPTAFGVDLLHVDVYRLESEAEIVALGLPELLDDGVVAAIEWGRRALPAIGPEHLSVELDLTDDNGARRLVLAPHGSRWRSRWPELEAAVEPTRSILRREAG